MFISRNYTYFGEGGQEDSTYRIGMADADFFMADADKMSYIGSILGPQEHLCEIRGSSPCFSCSAITVLSICPAMISRISHRLENEARKGPGISLMAEKYRRRTAVPTTHTASKEVAHVPIPSSMGNVVGS